MAKNLVYDIHDKPKFGNMLIFALQQVLAILAATIAVPAIIGLPTQMPAAIFGAGMCAGTLMQCFRERVRSGASSDKIFTVNSPFPSKATQWKLLPSIRVHREKNWEKNGRRGC